jgi:hypothetical protein
MIGTGTALALAGGGLYGAAKGYQNKKASERDRFIRSETIRNSPWTGMSDPGETQRAGMLDSIAQGLMAGGIAGKALSGLSSPTNALLKGSGTPTMTSALSQDVLNKQILTNPALQRNSTWLDFLTEPA